MGGYAKLESKDYFFEGLKFAYITLISGDKYSYNVITYLCRIEN